MMLLKPRLNVVGNRPKCIFYNGEKIYCSHLTATHADRLIGDINEHEFSFGIFFWVCIFSGTLGRPQNWVRVSVCVCFTFSITLFFSLLLEFNKSPRSANKIKLIKAPKSKFTKKNCLIYEVVCWNISDELKH